ncbi:MAG TPA: hypothetical protein VIY86_11865, partial [Pirellulaceae bacterium]
MPSTSKAKRKKQRHLRGDKSSNGQASSPTPLGRVDDDGVGDACPNWTRFPHGPHEPWRLSKLLPGHSHPLHWCVDAWLKEARRDSAVPASDGDMLLAAGTNGEPRNGTPRRGSESVASLLRFFESARPDTVSGLRWIAIAHDLHDSHHELKPLIWERLWNELLRVVAESRLGNQFHDVLAAQLHTVELPLTLAHVFPHAAQGSDLGRIGRMQFEESLENLVADHGSSEQIPFGELLPVLACWTRSAALVRRDSEGGLNKLARVRFADYLRAVLGFARRDGKLPLEPALSAAAVKARKDMFRHAIRLAKSKRAAKALPLGHRARARVLEKGSPSPVFVSDAARYAVLRGHATSPMQLVCDYSRAEMRLELTGSRT